MPKQEKTIEYYEGPTIQELGDRQSKAEQFVALAKEFIKTLEEIEPKHEDVTELVDEDLIDDYPGGLNLGNFIRELSDSVRQHEQLLEEIGG